MRSRKHVQHLDPSLKRNLFAAWQNGRASLGDALYRIITDVEFDPDDFLSTVDLTSEHKILDLKDRIEASVIIWNRKVHNKDGKSSWGSAVSQEKREQFEERAQTLLLIIKHRFPGIPQSTLDIAKIQENRVSTEQSTRCHAMQPLAWLV